MNRQTRLKSLRKLPLPQLYVFKNKFLKYQTHRNSIEKIKTEKYAAFKNEMKAVVTRLTALHTEYVRLQKLLANQGCPSLIADLFMRKSIEYKSQTIDISAEVKLAKEAYVFPKFRKDTIYEVLKNRWPYGVSSWDTSHAKPEFSSAVEKIGNVRIELLETKEFIINSEYALWQDFHALDGSLVKSVVFKVGKLGVPEFRGQHT